MLFGAADDVTAVAARGGAALAGRTEATRGCCRTVGGNDEMPATAGAPAEPTEGKAEANDGDGDGEGDSAAAGMLRLGGSASAATAPADGGDGSSFLARSPHDDGLAFALLDGACEADADVLVGVDGLGEVEAAESPSDVWFDDVNTGDTATAEAAAAADTENDANASPRASGTTGVDDPAPIVSSLGACSSGGSTWNEVPSRKPIIQPFACS